MPVRLLLICAFFLLSGCASYHAQRADLSDQVDLWLAQDQYLRVLTTLDALRPSHPEYETLQARVPEIQEQSKTYRQQALVRAESLALESNWAAAVAVLDKALNNLGENEVLLEQRSKYESERLRSISQSESAILMARARFLLVSRSSEETLLRANPDGFWSRQRFRSFNIEVQQTANSLTQLGDQWLEEGNDIAAVEALVLANRLSPQALLRDRLSAIYASDRQSRPAPTEVNGSTEVALAELETALNQALQMNDLAEARHLTNDIAELDPAAAGEHERLVEARIDAHGEVLLERGRLLYSQGFLQEALDVWQEALRFKPGDVELQAYAERAETFLRNLDQWGE
ncbi:MAG: hypothetical protein LAT65_06985 [Saccharospirillum sp.]|nr:hypothetical protein [Saccharospirillum sp.]